MLSNHVFKDQVPSRLLLFAERRVGNLNEVNLIVNRPRPSFPLNSHSNDF